MLEFGGLVAIKATRVSVAKPGHSCSVGGEHQQRSEHLSSGGTEYRNSHVIKKSTNQKMEHTQWSGSGKTRSGVRLQHLLLEFVVLAAINATRVSVAKPGHCCSVGGEHQQRSEHLSSGGTEYH